MTQNPTLRRMPAFIALAAAATLALAGCDRREEPAAPATDTVPTTPAPTTPETTTGTTTPPSGTMTEPGTTGGTGMTGGSGTGDGTMTDPSAAASAASQ